MYDIALTVEACLRAGTRVDVGWAVATEGISSRDWSEAVAITPGGGRTGGVLSGSLNEQLADRAEQGIGARVLRLQVSEVDAMVAGLSCGGAATAVLLPATSLPGELWGALRRREPVCLVLPLDGDDVHDVTMFTADDVDAAGEDAAQLFARGTSASTVTADAVVTVLFPVPTLLVVGAGAIPDALMVCADLLGWHTQVTSDAATATGVIAGLARIDVLVVTSHDDDVAGRALAAALDGEVGYIGALGSRRKQQARADWLAYRGVVDLSRVHGPAGLDIGAGTAAEIAVSIVAEAIAVRSGHARSGEQPII
ncbi:XdhC family protein [Angustibacter sp. McL0619]|uniref:XdhC family protein n=1 Tax=Angustibacter sp. McL0619 TaxID=3415676 RepID=UPI003CF69E8E